MLLILQSIALMLIIILIIYSSYRLYMKLVDRFDDGVSTTFNDYRDAKALLDRLRNDILNVLYTIKKDLNSYKDFGEYREFAMHLLKNFNPDHIHEVVPGGEDTSFVIDKSNDEFGICLRNGYGKLHDYSTLQFVIYHELSHIAVVEIGHTSQFWDTFGWLLKYLNKNGLYQPVDYSKHNVQYCGKVSEKRGVLITYNPFYDKLEKSCPMLS